MSGGPFIVRHLEPRQTAAGPDREHMTVLSVRACETLGDARKIAFNAGVGDQTWPELVTALMNLGSEGGRVPLPDGGEVRVEETTWEHLAAVGMVHALYGDAESNKAAILRGFNARQEGGA